MFDSGERLFHQVDTTGLLEDLGRGTIIEERQGSCQPMPRFGLIAKNGQRVRHNGKERAEIAGPWFILVCVRTSKDLDGKILAIRSGQRLKGSEQFDSLIAHAYILALFLGGGDDAAVAHVDDAVGEGGGLGVVGDHDDGLVEAVVEVAHQVQYQVGVFAVEVAGGFVSQE